jgi:hypothetical protein
MLGRFDRWKRHMAEDISSPPRDTNSSLQTRWIYGLMPDTAIAWCWVPLYLAAHAITSQHTVHADRTFGVVMTLVLLISLLHQPLTLLLVYGDGGQFRLHPNLFIWGPCVAGAVTATIVVLKLWVVLIPLIAVWQVFHTQQQRYGVLRVYSRKSGYGSAQLDRIFCFAPLLCVIVLLTLLSTPRDQMARMGAILGGTNVETVNLLFGLRPAALMLLPLVIVVIIGVVVAIVRQEWPYRDGVARNPARWNYLAGSAALIVSLVFDPAAGVASYVFAHAAEYVIIVDRTLRSRYARGGLEDRPLLSVLAGTTVRRWLLLVVFLIGLVAVDMLLAIFVSVSAYVILVYTITLLHFVYDGAIWKTRKSTVAADFGIACPPVART